MTNGSLGLRVEGGGSVFFGGLTSAINHTPRVSTCEVQKRLAHNWLVITFCIILLSSGCAAPAKINAGPNSPTLLIVAPSDATPTATPFLPIPPTPTYIPTAFPTLPPTVNSENTSGGTGPTELLGSTDKHINILLLGSDQRIGEGGFRTDTIILLSVNSSQKTASMVSFPRDLYVYIPGWTYQRINTAMFHGGFEILAQTIEYNFGLKPEYYVMINFWAFEQAIDSFDGIDVQIARTLTDQRSGYGQYTVPAGQAHMDGTTALWYARSRSSTNDFDRTRRQQEVIQAIIERLLSMNAIERADELYDIYIENVSTNLTWSDIAPMLPLAVQLSDTSHIQHYFIGPAEVINWTTPSGGQVLLPRQDAIIAVLRQALGNP